jgi:hypothetical protein
MLTSVQQWRRCHRFIERVFLDRLCPFLWDLRVASPMQPASHSDCLDIFLKKLAQATKFLGDGSKEIEFSLSLSCRLLFHLVCLSIYLCELFLANSQFKCFAIEQSVCAI